MSTRQLIMKVDYFDQAWRAEEAGQGLYDEARIEALIRRCKESGFTHIFWRTSVVGRVAYPSKVMSVFESEYRLAGNVLAKCLAQFDPFAVAIEAARRYKLAIAPWIATVDSYAPGLEDPFFARNPHLLLMDRKNKCVERGVPCYAYPEVRQYRLAEAREVINDYATDGIFYSSHSHNDITHCQGDIEGPLAYGYNPPIAEAYKARYGTDPRTGAFDGEKMSLLRGEFYHQFLREAKDIASRRGGALHLEVAIPDPGTTKILGAGLYAGPRGEYHIPLKELLEVADNVTFHCRPEHVDRIAGIFAECPANRGYWLLIHAGFNRAAAETAMTAWRPVLKKISKIPHLIGFSFHESMAFEFDCPELWDFAEECTSL